MTTCLQAENQCSSPASINNFPASALTFKFYTTDVIKPFLFVFITSALSFKRGWYFAEFACSFSGYVLQHQHACHYHSTTDLTELHQKQLQPAEEKKKQTLAQNDSIFGLGRIQPFHWVICYIRKQEISVSFFGIRIYLDTQNIITLQLKIIRSIQGNNQLTDSPLIKAAVCNIYR